MLDGSVKLQLWTEFLQGMEASFNSKLDVAYSIGLANGGAGGGFTQEQVDHMIAEAVAVKVAEKDAELAAYKESVKSQILQADEEEKVKILAALS